MNGAIELLPHLVEIRSRRFAPSCSLQSSANQPCDSPRAIGISRRATHHAAPLPMARIVNSSKLTARRAVGSDCTSTLAYNADPLSLRSRLHAKGRHNSLQERTSGRSLGPAAEPPRNSPLATGNRPPREGRSPLSKSPLGGRKYN